jgi:hypothetical protein
MRACLELNEIILIGTAIIRVFGVSLKIKLWGGRADLGSLKKYVSWLMPP